MTRALAPGEFYGATSSLQVADAILSEVAHFERRTLPAHTHEWPYFSVLLEGSYVETTGRTTINYRPLTPSSTARTSPIATRSVRADRASS